MSVLCELVFLVFGLQVVLFHGLDLQEATGFAYSNTVNVYLPIRVSFIIAYFVYKMSPKLPNLLRDLMILTVIISAIVAYWVHQPEAGAVADLITNRYSLPKLAATLLKLGLKEVQADIVTMTNIGGVLLSFWLVAVTVYVILWLVTFPIRYVRGRCSRSQPAENATGETSS